MKKNFFNSFSWLIAATVFLQVVACSGGKDAPAPEAAVTAVTKDEAPPAAKTPTEDEYVGKFIEAAKKSDPELVEANIRASWKTMVVARPVDFNDKVIGFIYTNDRVFRGLVDGSIELNTQVAKKCFGFGYAAPMAPAEIHSNNEFFGDKPLFQLAQAGSSDAGPLQAEGEGNLQNPCALQLENFGGITYAAKDRLKMMAGTLGYTITDVDFAKSKETATAIVKSLTERVLVSRNDKDVAQAQTDFIYDVAVIYNNATVTYNNAQYTWFKFNGVMKREDAVLKLRPTNSEETSDSGKGSEIERRTEDPLASSQRGEVTWIEFKAVEDNPIFQQPTRAERERAGSSGTSTSDQIKVNSEDSFKNSLINSTRERGRERDGGDGTLQGVQNKP